MRRGLTIKIRRIEKNLSAHIPVVNRRALPSMGLTTIWRVVIEGYRIPQDAK